MADQQPTIAGAAEWILKQLTTEYKKKCVLHWKSLYGAEFTAAVGREVRQRESRKKPASPALIPSEE